MELMIEFGMVLPCFRHVIIIITSPTLGMLIIMIFPESIVCLCEGKNFKEFLNVCKKLFAFEAMCSYIDISAGWHICLKSVCSPNLHPKSSDI